MVLALRDDRRNEITSRPILSARSTLTDEPGRRINIQYNEMQTNKLEAHQGLPKRHVPFEQEPGTGKHYPSTTAVDRLLNL
jgi:hypothetical protein